MLAVKTQTNEIYVFEKFFFRTKYSFGPGKNHFDVNSWTIDIQ